MPSGPETLTDVPADQLQSVIAGFAEEGATATVTKQPDGNYTIVANFPTPPTSTSSPPNGTILSRPGIPWVVVVDGPDLVVRNILATCFGGEFDSGDDGQTESGIMNDGYPTAGADPMGVALPIRSTEAATQKSPLAFGGEHIQWKTIVKVWREADGEPTAIACLLIDNGPDVLQYPSHALDLNPNVALHFVPGYDPTKIANDWSGTGFSYRIIGGAQYVSPYPN